MLTSGVHVREMLPLLAPVAVPPLAAPVTAAVAVVALLPAGRRRMSPRRPSSALRASSRSLIFVERLFRTAIHIQREKGDAS